MISRCTCQGRTGTAPQNKGVGRQYNAAISREDFPYCPARVYIYIPYKQWLSYKRKSILDSSSAGQQAAKGFTTSVCAEVCNKPLAAPRSREDRARREQEMLQHAELPVTSMLVYNKNPLDPCAVFDGPRPWTVLISQ